MRVEVLATVMCLSMVGLAVAADTRAAIVKMPTNIPAQGLGPALKTLAKDRGFQVVFRSEVVGSARTQGATGNLTTPEALTELLKGTDLSYSYLDENTVTIISHESLVADSPRSDQPQPPSTAKEGKNNSSQEFRVAQVDQTNAGPQVISDESSNKKKEKDDGLAEIVVTGTHIRGAQLSSPVIVIDRDYIDRSGYTDIGDVLRSLPQNFSGGYSPTIASYNTSPGGGVNASGASAPDLRGIGASSTLTLGNLCTGSPR